MALSASVYQAFRAPTLNELYRNFRQGNTLTLANPALTGEHLTGGEAGISAQYFQSRLTVRGNFFWSDINDPVANVTLTVTPNLITRMKENLGRTQARGFELAGQYQITSRFQVSASYLFVNSIVLDFPTQPGGISLVGLRLPQVPQNSFSVQTSYIARKWSASAQARFLGNQFDDDQNMLPLGQAFSLDAQVSYQILPRASLFFAAQNITDDRFEIARTPVTNVGPPTMVRGGFRFNFSKSQN
jgi:iron complex outermembrane receptor protein